jgi:outer membrane protein assembly factor BamB
MVTATGTESDRSATDIFTVRTDWPQYHYSPDLSGVNPYENVLSTRNVGNLQLDWQRATATNGYLSSPAVVSGVVYIGDEDPVDPSVHALDAHTGETIWTTMVGPGPSDVSVGDGQVYTGDLFGVLHALDATTGAEVWSLPLGRIYGATTVADGVVYAETSSGDVLALDGATGDIHWRFSKPLVNFTGAPAVANGVVYAAGNPSYVGNGLVFAVDASTGEQIWKIRMPGAYQGLEASVAVAGDTLYLGTTEGNPRSVVVALSADTGQIKWLHPLPEDVDTGFSSAPAVAGGLVYVPTNTNGPSSVQPHLFALEADTGRMVWKRPVSHSYSAPAVANGVVYVGGQAGDASQLTALDARTGQILWAYREEGTERPILSSPAVADGRVYVATQVGTQSVLSFSLP